MFTGFPEETLQFFLDIRFHNDKAYFAEHKPRYERDVKAVFHAFIEALAPTMQKIDPLMEIRPYKCLARIHRDTRFSKDKSPFRDHLWMCFRRAAEPREGSVNFFFELGPTTLGWGMGTWGENRPMMDALRRHITANPAQVEKTLRAAKLAANDFGFFGSTWKRIAIPENVPECLHPWYAGREIYVGKQHPDMGQIGSAAILDTVRADFEALAPLYHLLRGAYDEAANDQSL